MESNREPDPSNFKPTCTKYTLSLLNVVFVIASVLSISGAISTIVTFTPYYNMMRFGLDTMTVTWLVIGIILLIVALFGIFTTFKESTALANIYAVLMMVVFILQLEVSIFSFTLINQTPSMVSMQLTEMMTEYPNAFRVEVDWIQTNFRCCGIEGPDDWEQIGRLGYYTNYYNETGLTPVSCCEQYSNYVSLKCERFHGSGCFDPIYQIVSASVMLAGTFGIIFSALQLPGIFLGFYYARIVRSKKTQRDMQIWNPDKGCSISVVRQPTDYSPANWQESIVIH